MTDLDLDAVERLTAERDAALADLAAELTAHDRTRVVRSVVDQHQIELIIGQRDAALAEVARLMGAGFAAMNMATVTMIIDQLAESRAETDRLTAALQTIAAGLDTHGTEAEAGFCRGVAMAALEPLAPSDGSKERPDGE